MMQKLKKPVSILLVFMMIVSLFTVVPISASADVAPDEYAEIGDTFDDNEVQFEFYAVTLKGGTYKYNDEVVTDDITFGDPEAVEGADGAYIADDGRFVHGADVYYPVDKNGDASTWYVIGKSDGDDGYVYLVLGGYDPNAAPTYTLTCTDALVDAFDVNVTPQFFDVEKDNWDVYAEKGVAYNILSEPDDNDLAVMFSVIVPNGTAFNASDITVTMGDTALTIGEVSDWDTDKDVVVGLSGYSTYSAYNYSIRKGELTGNLVVDYAPTEALPVDIVISPESGNITEALAAAEEGKTVGDITINLTEGVTYTISDTITVPASLTINGNGATIEAGSLNAPMIALTAIANPTEWTEVDIAVSRLTVKGLKQPMFYSAGKNYLCKTFTVDDCVVEVAANVSTFDFTKGSSALVFELKNSTFYAPVATTRSFYTSQSGQKVTEAGDYTQTFKLTNNTFYNLAYNKNFFTHRQNNQKWLGYEAKGNVFVNTGKSGQAISGLNGGTAGANPTWDIDGNLFNYDGVDTSAAENTGDTDEPVNNSIAGVVTFVDAAAGDFNGTVELSDGATLPAKLGDPRYTLSVPAPADTYTVAGSSAAMFGTTWDATNTANDMTLSEGVYSITYTDVQPEETIQLKVVKNHSWEESWGDKATGYNYTFSVKSACDVTVFFDPATETVSVTGDGVTRDTELDVYSVIAVGNGEDTYLNGSNWDPCDPANAMIEVSDGVWELTMTDIYAFDNYQVKFAVNSVDEEGNPTSNPWAHNFGSEDEQLYPTGAAINAVYNGKNCIFGVEKDGSTVTLQLDLTNYDHATKEGAQMTIFISEPTEESTEESTEEPPALTVKAMIEALPANITLDNAADVQAARQAYDALSDTDKAQIDAATLKKLTDAEAKIADLTAAKAVSDAITALPTADQITYDNKTAIESASAAFNALTDAQKALVDSSLKQKLTADVTALEFVVHVHDAEALINALPAAANIALTDKTAVQAARAAYDALTGPEKGAIDPNALTKLTNAETKIADLEAAKAVSDQINALPSNLALNNKPAVVAARNAYNALTNARKNLIDSDTLGKLTAAEAKIADLEAAMSVSVKINALPNNVTLNNKKAVRDARTGYNNLTDAQKALVDNSTLEKLAAAEAKIADLEAAKAVSDAINALPAAANVALTDKTAVQNARTAYNALTDAQKDLVDANTLKKLTDAEDVIAAETVAAQINALPAADNVALTDKTNILNARTAYNALTDAQKDLVDANTLKKLTDAEAKITDLETAKTVTDAITALPAAANVALTDKTAIQNARTAYNALTDAQKALVDDGDLEKLAAAEAKIADLEAAKAVSDTINALPAAANVALTDKTAIQNARTAYNALTDARKALVDDGDLEKLAAAEAKIADLEAAKAVTDAINALPATDEVTLDDKATVEAARAAYNALTDAQKDLVDKNTLKKLTDDEEKLAELQAMSEVSAKTGKDATYNGKELPLVNAPTTALPQGCTMKYALGKDADTPPADDQFTADVPTAKDAGIYYVWYKAVGDEGHPSTEPECKIVRLAKAVLTVIAKNQTVQYGDPVVQGRYTVKGLAKGDKVVVQLYAKIATNEVKSTVTANKNYTVKKVSGILTIKGSPIAKALPSGNTISVSYAKVKNADGYDIYAGYCGSNSYPLAKAVKGGAVTSAKLTQVGGKAIDTKKNVFLYVVAYKNIGGKKVTLVRSTSIRIAGLNTKHTNAKSVGGVKPAVTLKKGATLILKPSVTPVDPKKPVYANPAKFMFASHNNSVATVDAKGRITAVGKGTANIYTYASNGVKTLTVVTVK